MRQYGGDRWLPLDTLPLAQVIRWLSIFQNIPSRYSEQEVALLQAKITELEILLSNYLPK